MRLKRQALRAPGAQTPPARSAAVRGQVDLALEALGAFVSFMGSPERLLGQFAALLYLFPRAARSTRRKPANPKVLRVLIPLLFRTNTLLPARCEAGEATMRG
jgi:hypothetical protein